MKAKSKPITIRLSHKAERCREYLQSKKVNWCRYLLEGGEPLLIEKVIEFYYKPKKENYHFKLNLWQK